MVGTLVIVEVVVVEGVSVEGVVVEVVVEDVVVVDRVVSGGEVLKVVEAELLVLVNGWGSSELVTGWGLVEVMLETLLETKGVTD